MGWWRKEVIDFALDQDTARLIDEQKEWITRDPSNPAPFYRLALLYRMQGREEEALGLLLEALRLAPGFGDAHAALAEIHAVRGAYADAWRHARLAEAGGQPRAAEMLRRHGIVCPEPG
ncbi:MAG: tetratricopeptide repeat protein [Bryobacteraceae bacterium]